MGGWMTGRVAPRGRVTDGGRVSPGGAVTAGGGVSPGQRLAGAVWTVLGVFGGFGRPAGLRCLGGFVWVVGGGVSAGGDGVSVVGDLVEEDVVLEGRAGL